MNMVIGSAPHPSDGDLVRYLDTELAELDERRLRTHLDGCAACAVRIEQIASDSSAVASYLAGSAPTAPDMVTRARALAGVRRAGATRRRSRRPALRAAAAACALLVLSLSAQPVRAWMMERWEGARATAVRAPEVAKLPANVVRRSSVVAFAPRGARFDVQLESFQADGTLTIQVRGVERATAQVLDGSHETLLILPSGLRVENTASSRASYRVTVPADLPLIRVTVAGHTLASYSVEKGAVPSSRSFPLGQGAAR
jgi:anti-sigma factor RsiW